MVERDTGVLDDAARTRLGRFGVLLLAVNLGWALPSAAATTLLQALLARQHGPDKATWLAVITTVGAVVAVVAMIVAGAWSDRTRGRFGRRYPWMVGGTLTAAVGLALTGVAPPGPLQILTFVLFQGGLNAMLAAAGALVPDRVARTSLGKASAYTGFGYLLGNMAGGFVAAAFIGDPAVGLAVVPWTMVIAVLAMVFLVAPQRIERDPRSSASAVLRTLHPPRDRDFALVFFGRFAVVLGLMVIVFYQLYIYTDFLHVDAAQAAADIAAGGLLLGVVALLATVGGGLLSDRLGRRRPLVVIASLLVAASAVPTVVAPGVPSLMVLYVLAGAGFGMYLSVDQALMVEVLPTVGGEAKELGMLSIANSAPSVVAPVLATLTVGLFGFRALFLLTVILAGVGGLCVAAVRRVR
ncbi:MFS transporter [Kutzneria sp. NPDC052558]|uniref:MFS transporter n=1 Tax=Kutzneria sp. NPDC052558 TaxID=3364121 RepID=UPI0037CBDFDB